VSNPRKPDDLGTNRTGIASSPVDAQEAVAEARAATPRPDTDGDELLAERVRFSRAAAPVGTMPPPMTAKGVAKMAVDAVRGKHPLMFIDLLAERLAFERTGTRLYEALLAKYDAAHPHPGGPMRDDLERIRDEELRHFGLLTRALESLGADPTAVTPSADVTGVLASGLVQVLTDPRVTLTEGLKAIQLAELADNDGWLLLTDVAARLGHDQLALQFQHALAQEEEHLTRVRSWVGAAVEGQAGLDAGGEGSPDGRQEGRM
jgi:rubrerythrin